MNGRDKIRARVASVGVKTDPCACPTGTPAVALPKVPAPPPPVVEVAPPKVPAPPPPVVEVAPPKVPAPPPPVVEVPELPPPTTTVLVHQPPAAAPPTTTVPTYQPPYKGPPAIEPKPARPILNTVPLAIPAPPPPQGPCDIDPRSADCYCTTHPDPMDELCRDHSTRRGGKQAVAPAKGFGGPISGRAKVLARIHRYDRPEVPACGCSGYTPPAKSADVTDYTSKSIAPTDIATVDTGPEDVKVSVKFFGIAEGAQIFRAKKDGDQWVKSYSLLDQDPRWEPAAFVVSDYVPATEQFVYVVDYPSGMTHAFSATLAELVDGAISFNAAETASPKVGNATGCGGTQSNVAPGQGYSTAPAGCPGGCGVHGGHSGRVLCIEGGATPCQMPTMPMWVHGPGYASATGPKAVVAGKQGKAIDPWTTEPFGIASKDDVAFLRFINLPDGARVFLSGTDITANVGAGWEDPASRYVWRIPVHSGTIFPGTLTVTPPGGAPRRTYRGYQTLTVGQALDIHYLTDMTVYAGTDAKRPHGTILGAASSTVSLAPTLGITLGWSDTMALPYVDERSELGDVSVGRHTVGVGLFRISRRAGSPDELVRVINSAYVWVAEGETVYVEFSESASPVIRERSIAPAKGLAYRPAGEVSSATADTITLALYNFMPTRDRAAWRTREGFGTEEDAVSFIRDQATHSNNAVNYSTLTTDTACNTAGGIWTGTQCVGGSAGCRDAHGTWSEADQTCTAAPGPGAWTGRNTSDLILGITQFSHDIITAVDRGAARASDRDFALAMQGLANQARQQQRTGGGNDSVMNAQLMAMMSEAVTRMGATVTPPSPPVTKDNTLLYVAGAAVALGAVYMITQKNKAA